MQAFVRQPLIAPNSAGDGLFQPSWYTTPRHLHATEELAGNRLHTTRQGAFTALNRAEEQHLHFLAVDAVNHFKYRKDMGRYSASMHQLHKEQPTISGVQVLTHSLQRASDLTELVMRTAPPDTQTSISTCLYCCSTMWHTS